jgi:hypothetical protein
MADAPSGGGSSWGPFEVLLILLLAIGLLSNISGKSNTLSTTNPKNENIHTVDTSANRCGLSVTAPLSLERVYGSVRLSGSVNGCNWKPDGNTALFAQVINGAGVPVSDFTPVINNGTNFINTSFDTTIYLNTNPSGTGYLILIPAIQDPNRPITVRIPLRFVRS